MTDPFVPGGAGLPDPQSSPVEATPGATPEAAPEAAPDTTSDTTSAWPPGDPMTQPTPAPTGGGAGFGVPTGQGFDAPPGSGFDAPPAGPPMAAAGGTPAGWTPGPALKATNAGRSGLKRIAVIAVVVLAVAILGVTFKDRLAGKPSDLSVGDCFDVPAAGEADTVSSVQHQPCTESHTGEVILVVAYTASVTAYPAVSDFDSFVGTTCKPAFQAYVGTDLDSDPDLSIGYFYPLADGWGTGDRSITCYVARSDDGPMTTSVKGSAMSSAAPSP